MTKPFYGAPQFFIDLHSRIDRREHRADCLDATDFELSRSDCGKWFVTSPISQAASKFLLAKNTVGLELDGYQAPEPQENYTGQLVFTMTVAAFETYCRMSKKRWFKIYRDIFTDDDGRNFRGVSEAKGIEPDFYDRLAGAQDEQQLKDKINEFASGDDEINFYAICVGFRNAFAHGRLGSLNGTLPLAKSAREIVLASIERHCIAQTALIV